jgi:hypothetical protein
MTKYKWLIPLVVCVLIGIAVAGLLKKCNYAPDHSADNATVQAIIKAKSADSLKLAILVNKQNGIIISLQDSVKRLNQERQSILMDLSTAKTTAIFYRNQIAYATVKHDTLLYQSSCDSLAQSFDGYVTQSEKEKQNSELLINAQGKVISSQDTTIKAQQQYIDIAHFRIDTLAQKYGILYSDYLKTAKKSKWQQVKEKGLLGVLIAETGYIIISSIKK